MTKMNKSKHKPRKVKTGKWADLVNLPSRKLKNYLTPNAKRKYM